MNRTVDSIDIEDCYIDGVNSEITADILGAQVHVRLQRLFGVFLMFILSLFVQVMMDEIDW